MGLGSITNILSGGESKGPSAEEIARKQREAAEKERQKIALEEAQMSAQEDIDLQNAYEQSRSKRRAFTSTISDDDETSRRKFLKGV